ncbi:MAG TPA: hydroxymethylpyrimidine/phosphomethylpyrimidine kinase [Rhodocyclaceae bacterium]|jgi:hydroxymethylpyrimidine/phosphomethylpyrimidine kinase|nr:hydroxymethylpyrimidine/phosphomethylpyrimidine kinase [Rhodocyclaceae bacterium]HRQ45901.1 hydroxymethylpyrimidine/phosphomethylpyrimidine kinase [Rhodocyclaceae bacterium]
MSAPITPVPPSVLCFATADATGGADLQSDVLTLASMGCHPLSVVCAIAVRDTRGVDDLVPLDVDLVAAQARAVLEDIPVRAFKLGMAGNVENLAAIAEILSDYPDVPLVLDPALPHLDGDDAMAEDYLAALAELILPQATLLVAGRHEIWRLAGSAGDEDDDDTGSDGEGVSMLLGLGVDHVLVTGTGEPGLQYVNVLYGPGGVVRTDSWERLGGHYLGARATLSAAVAAELAHGMDLREAVREAQEFTWQTLNGAYRPGMGLALPDRLFWARDGGESDD